ncbi:MAG: YeeE/YedE family protein [Lentisphaeria bacterium]|nr:YeeE/YedE family protein [Lentisphaeria bacterium]
MNKIQNTVGALLLILTLIVGSHYLKSDMLLLRLILGMGLGYALTRGFFGFAGSVNRAYRGGSTRLMQVLMWMFVVTAIINAGFLVFEKTPQFNLWIMPINLGLMIGGILFGFGMSFSSCCASGVMTDLVTDLPRAGVTLLFFGIGVFVGFPLSGGPNSLSIITDTWFETAGVYAQTTHGVFLPDLFGTGLLSYIGAIVLTAVFAGIVIHFSKIYQASRAKNGTLHGIESEHQQEKEVHCCIEKSKSITADSFWSEETYLRFFVTPWSMTRSAAMVVVIFTIMLATTKVGWGASVPFGIWIGQLLVFFGIPIESVANFSARPIAMYAKPFFEHPISVQNFGIVIGTLICVLLMGKVTLRHKFACKPLLLFALGGFCMGFGTRFSNGCNVGALYTPIANFSLSGWIFLVFIILGGIIGNTLSKKLEA